MSVSTGGGNGILPLSRMAPSAGRRKSEDSWCWDVLVFEDNVLGQSPLNRIPFYPQPTAIAAAQTVNEKNVIGMQLNGSQNGPQPVFFTIIRLPWVPTGQLKHDR